MVPSLRGSSSRAIPALLALGALAVVQLAACGSSSSPSGLVLSGDDGSTGDDGGKGGGNGNVQDGSGSTSGDTGGGGVFVTSSDGGGSGDSNACSQINIGIIGLPGTYSSSSFQAWLVSAGTTVASIQTTATDPLTAAELAPFDVVILYQLQRDYTAQEAAIFAAWVQAGGGVASMSGYQNNTTIDFHANSLLAPLEVAYADPFFLMGPVTDFATHPITKGLTSITFDGGYTVADLGGTASTRTPIAFLPYAGDDAGVEPVGTAVTMGAGHAFVWGDEWISFDSEWSNMPEIKQFWVQVFGWIAAPTKCALVPPQ